MSQTAAHQKYNLKSPSVKRILQECKELREPTEQYYAQPLEENLFEWHFTVRGPSETDFEGGFYHGRIILPTEYPFKPPSIILLTPNGRFEVGTKICLSISAHHPEFWQPSWSIRTVLLAIISFMPTKGNGAIGSLDYTTKERKVLAARSLEWKCETCECTPSAALLEEGSSSPVEVSQIDAEAISQIGFKGEGDKEAAASSTPPSSSSSATAKEQGKPAPPQQSPSKPTTEAATSKGENKSSVSEHASSSTTAVEKEPQQGMESKASSNSEQDKILAAPEQEKGAANEAISPSSSGATSHDVIRSSGDNRATESSGIRPSVGVAADGTVYESVGGARASERQQEQQRNGAESDRDYVLYGLVGLIVALVVRKLAILTDVYDPSQGLF
eukprot:Nk52_evm33s242 gene=Nk52_evmTU33s242